MIKKFFYILLALFFTVNTLDTASNLNPKADTDNTNKAESNKPDSEEGKIDAQKSNKGVEINFENISLQTFIDYVFELYHCTPITREPAQGANQAPGGGANKLAEVKPLKDIKISYKSYAPMSEKQIWALLDLFLEISGYTRIAKKNVGKRIFEIMPSVLSNKEVLPTYFSIDPENLPNNGRIRYVYFLKNAPVDQVRSLLDKIKSTNAQVDYFNDLKAIIMTDTAYAIKSVFNIVKEIDTGYIPEVLSILKLRNADATEVAKLYSDLKPKDNPSSPIYGHQKNNKSNSYFPVDTKVVPEPRTNSLIILGTKESVRRIEDFISNNLDTTLKSMSRPLHVYQLNFAPAKELATILNKVITYSPDGTARDIGGVRAGEKFFSSVYIEPEEQGNRLLIRATKEDYELLKPTIKELDMLQPQVVIEVLIVNLTLDKTKQAQSALRNRTNSTVNFQTTGFFGNSAQINTSKCTDATSTVANCAGSLVTNLINLAISAVSGTTLISLGKESVWSLIGILDSTTQLTVVSNPFLTASNKYASTVQFGQIRRVQQGVTDSGTPTNYTNLANESAAIQLNIVPQISKYGIIGMDITVTIEEFTDDNISVGNKSSKQVKTYADVGDGEVLALGGLIQNRETTANSKVPILGDIPIIKYFFSNNTKTKENDNLLIFVAPKIVWPKQNSINPHTYKKANYLKSFACEMEGQNPQTDPIYNHWLKSKKDVTVDIIDNMVPESKNPQNNSGANGSKRASLKNMVEGNI